MDGTSHEYAEGCPILLFRHGWDVPSMFRGLSGVFSKESSQLYRMSHKRFETPNVVYITCSSFFTSSLRCLSLNTLLMTRYFFLWDVLGHPVDIGPPRWSASFVAFRLIGAVVYRPDLTIIGIVFFCVLYSWTLLQ